jgi:hypothetical protein
LDAVKIQDNEVGTRCAQKEREEEKGSRALTFASIMWPGCQLNPRICLH